MNGLGIFHGKIILFRYSNSLQNGEILLIEKLGDEEGTGAWSLKKIIFEHPSSKRNQFGDDLGSDNPIVLLRSYNPKFSPQTLDPTGQYRIRGVFLETVADGDVSLVHTETLRVYTEQEESISPSAGQALRVLRMRPDDNLQIP
jgi:hypothetical protein